MPDMSVSASLLAWQGIAHQFKSGGLLVGNGASCAVWADFGYKSLYDRAASSKVRGPLSPVDQSIFLGLDTTNFETVLRALIQSMIVCHAIGQGYREQLIRYWHVRRALVQAVKEVHVPHANLTSDQLGAIHAELRNYRNVYSTNYDLLLYWAVMVDPTGFADYFWSDGNTFDVTNTTLFDQRATRILYLHGGLHLVRLALGQAKKVVAGGSTLLDRFGQRVEKRSTPLFVSEGRAEDKIRAINSSDYLSFAYHQLAHHSGPLIVFGHGLDPNMDRHLTDAIKSARPDPLAISIRPHSSLDTMDRKTTLMKDLDRDDILFFEAATHPLGAPDLRTMP